MKINVIYMAQAKKAVGVTNEIISLDKSCTIHEFIVNQLCEQHKKLKSCLIDENKLVRKVVAIFVGDTKVELESPNHLKDGDEVTIMPPIAGG